MKNTEANFLESISCPRCGNDNSRLVVKGLDRLHKIQGEYYASECVNCGLWFQNPRPIASRLTSLYPETYLPHQKPETVLVRSGTARFLRRHLGYETLMPDDLVGRRMDWRQLPIFDWVRKWQTGVNLIPIYVQNGKLLEIGCASGGRLLSLRRLGWQHLYGIELVPSAVERARAEGFEVICGQVEAALDQYDDERFDVIISSMVLEHLYNPFEVVKMITRKLKPGGQFIFSTVIRDSLDAKIFRDYWSGFDFPRHMVYFQKGDLLGMLKGQFEGIKVFHQNAPIDFIRPSLSRKEEGKGTVTDNLILNIARSPLANPMGLLLALLGLTCRVSLYCHRKYE